MKAALPLLVLLMLLPAAAAQAPTWLDVDRQLIGEFTSAIIAQDHSRGVESNALLPELPCNSGEFSAIQTGDDSFGFAEDQYEAGCGRLTASVVPPDGATAMTVEFQMNRQIADSEVLQPGFEQVFTIAGADGIFTFRPFESDEGASNFEPFTATVAVGDGPVSMDWWFNDRGIRSGLEEGNPVSETSYSSSVTGILFAFDGFDQEALVHSKVSLARGVQLEEHVVLHIDAPAAPDGLGQRLVLDFNAAYALNSVTAPGGRELSAGEYLLDTHDGRTTVILGNVLMAEHGAGVYSLNFNVGREFTSSAFIATTLGLLGVGFVAAMGLTASSYAESRRTLKKVKANIGAVAVVGMVMLAALGLALALWLFISGSWTVADSRPLSGAGITVMAFTLGGSLALLIMWQMLTGTTKVAIHQLDLERSNRELDEFSHIVTHDLRAPLRTVATFTGLLQKKHGGKLPKEAKEFVELVNGGAVRMSKLLDAVGHYSRVGRNQLLIEDVSMKKLVEDVRRDLRRDLIDGDARIQASDLPTIRAEPALMRELLLNLVQNAVKFRSPDRKPVVTIRGKQTGAGFLLTIADNGRGMDEREVRHIFEPFQRGSAAAGVPGTGMGLAVCRRIAERHGGRLGVESELGKGTTFFLHLPNA